MQPDPDRPSAVPPAGWGWLRWALTVLVSVAVVLAVVNWDAILDWLHPSGRGK